MTAVRIPAVTFPESQTDTTAPAPWSTLGLAFRLARRELRGGVRGLVTVLLCLALGVGVIAAVGSLRAAVDSGLAANGRQILTSEQLPALHAPIAVETQRFGLQVDVNAMLFKIANEKFPNGFAGIFFPGMRCADDQIDGDAEFCKRCG